MLPILVRPDVNIRMSFKSKSSEAISWEEIFIFCFISPISQQRKRFYAAQLTLSSVGSDATDDDKSHTHTYYYSCMSAKESIFTTQLIQKIIRTMHICLIKSVQKRIYKKTNIYCQQNNTLFSVFLGLRSKVAENSLKSYPNWFSHIIRISKMNSKEN